METWNVELMKSEPERVAAFTKFVERLGGTANDSGKRAFGEVVMCVTIAHEDARFLRAHYNIFNMARVEA